MILQLQKHTMYLNILNNISNIVKNNIQFIIKKEYIKNIKYFNSITNSSDQNTNWRKKQEWYTNGKRNECEKYQIKNINKINKIMLLSDKFLTTTDKRFNLLTYEFINCRYPNKNINGYEFTENMDGYINIHNINIYYNLKFIVGSGGSQTRSLRETYHFINAQINYILINDNSNIIFINILDGDEAHKNINKFKYLLNKYNTKYNVELQKKIFIGSLREYIIFIKMIYHIYNLHNFKL